MFTATTNTITNKIDLKKKKMNQDNKNINMRTEKGKKKEYERKGEKK